MKEKNVTNITLFSTQATDTDTRVEKKTIPPVCCESPVSCPLNGNMMNSCGLAIPFISAEIYRLLFCPASFNFSERIDFQRTHILSSVLRQCFSKTCPFMQNLRPLFKFDCAYCVNISAKYEVERGKGGNLGVLFLKLWKNPIIAWRKVGMIITVVISRRCPAAFSTSTRPVTKYRHRGKTCL